MSGRAVDAPAVFKRRDGYVTDWNDEGQASWLKSIGKRTPGKTIIRITEDRGGPA